MSLCSYEWHPSPQDREADLVFLRHLSKSAEREVFHFVSSIAPPLPSGSVAGVCRCFQLLGDPACGFAEPPLYSPGSGACGFICLPTDAYAWASRVAQLVKNPPAVRGTWVPSLAWEDPLEKGTATYSSVLAWRIAWTA